MAERRPLIAVAGELAELPLQDTLPGTFPARNPMPTQARMQAVWNAFAAVPLAQLSIPAAAGDYKGQGFFYKQWRFDCDVLAELSGELRWNRSWRAYQRSGPGGAAYDDSYLRDVTRLTSSEDPAAPESALAGFFRLNLRDAFQQQYTPDNTGKVLLPVAAIGQLVSIASTAKQITLPTDASVTEGQIVGVTVGTDFFTGVSRIQILSPNRDGGTSVVDTISSGTKVYYFTQKIAYTLGFDPTPRYYISYSRLFISRVPSEELLAAHATRAYRNNYDIIPDLFAYSATALPNDDVVLPGVDARLLPGATYSINSLRGVNYPILYVDANNFSINNYPYLKIKKVIGISIRNYRLGTGTYVDCALQWLNIPAGETVTLIFSTIDFTGNTQPGSSNSQSTVEGTLQIGHGCTVIGSPVLVGAGQVVYLGTGTGGTPYTLPTATPTRLGGIKASDTITVDADGTAHAANNTNGSNYNLPVGSVSVRGGFRVGAGLRVTGTDVLEALVGTNRASIILAVDAAYYIQNNTVVQLVFDRVVKNNAGAAAVSADRKTIIVPYDCRGLLSVTISMTRLTKNRVHDVYFQLVRAGTTIKIGRAMFPTVGPDTPTESCAGGVSIGVAYDFLANDVLSLNLYTRNDTTAQTQIDTQFPPIFSFLEI